MHKIHPPFVVQVTWPMCHQNTEPQPHTDIHIPPRTGQQEKPKCHFFIVELRFTGLFRLEASIASPYCCRLWKKTNPLPGWARLVASVGCPFFMMYSFIWKQQLNLRVPVTIVICSLWPLSFHPIRGRENADIVFRLLDGPGNPNFNSDCLKQQFNYHLVWATDDGSDDSEVLEADFWFQRHMMAEIWLDKGCNINTKLEAAQSIEKHWNEENSWQLEAQSNLW